MTEFKEIDYLRFIIRYFNPLHSIIDGIKQKISKSTEDLKYCQPIQPNSHIQTTPLNDGIIHIFFPNAKNFFQK